MSWCRFECLGVVVGVLVLAWVSRCCRGCLCVGALVWSWVSRRPDSEHEDMHGGSEWLVTSA